MALLLILFCLAATAFFAGIETGVISIHRMRLRHFVRQGQPGARVLQGFLDNPDRLLGTTLVGTNLSVVVVSVVSASLAVRYLGRWGEPSDIAQGVAFLCSPAAGWVTGEVLTVSGGLVGVSATPPKRSRK